MTPRSRIDPSVIALPLKRLLTAGIPVTFGVGRDQSISWSSSPDVMQSGATMETVSRALASIGKFVGLKFGSPGICEGDECYGWINNTSNRVVIRKQETDINGAVIVGLYPDVGQERGGVLATLHGNSLALAYSEKEIGLWHHNIEDGSFFCNNEFQAFFGFEADGTLSMWLDQLAIGVRGRVQEAFENSLSRHVGEHSIDLIVQMKRPAPEKLIRLTWTAVSNEQGTLIGLSGMAVDYSKDHHGGHVLDVYAKLVSAVVHAGRVGVFEWDLESDIVARSPEYLEMLGYGPGELSPSAKSFYSLLQPQGQLAYDQAVADCLARRDRVSFSLPVRARSGRSIFLECHLEPWRVASDSGEVKSILGAIVDRTHQLRVERHAKFLESHDPSTRLLNKDRFLKEAQKCLERAHNLPRDVAFIFADIDHFKAIHDTYGPYISERVLQEIAYRLIGITEKGQHHAKAARRSADQFLLFCVTKSVQELEVFLQETLAILSKPIYVECHQIDISVSLGVARGGHDGDAADDLVYKAEMAMLAAKEASRGGVSHYDASMSSKAYQVAMISRGLLTAIEHEEFVLFYQPQFTADGALVGMEALIRWFVDGVQFASPADFIPVAERHGRIGEIGTWVINQAIKQAGIWHREYGLDVPIAINVSAKQLADPCLGEALAMALSRNGVPGSLIELELTETALLPSNVPGVGNLMSKISSLGVRLSIDDFGTGHSCLSNLTVLPCSQIKIDRSFVQNMLTSSSAEIVVETILRMSEALKVDVIAEGVETVEQLRALSSKGCVKFQGYYFSRPLSVDDASKLISS